MSFQRRIQLDRIVAQPFAFALGVLARAIGPLLRRDHSAEPATSREIVVAKLVGMGSLVQATPLIRALKERFPAAHITILTLVGNREIASRLDDVCEILTIDDRSPWAMLRSTTSIILTLHRRRVDHYLDLEVYSSFAAILAYLSCARNRLGFHRHSGRFKQLGYSHLLYFNTRWPVRRLYLQLGRLIGCSADQAEIQRLRVNDADREHAARVLAVRQWPVGRPLVLVNVNASDLLLERRWPAESFASLTERLCECGCNVCLIGAPAERDYTAMVLSRVNSDAARYSASVAGELTIGSLLALMECSACVVTNDSGPMHFALGVQAPLVCLFGPGDPAHYAVWGDTVSVVYRPTSCSPCLYEIDRPPCRGDNVCMKQIDVGVVTDAVLRLIRPAVVHRRQLSVLQDSERVCEWSDADGHPLGAVLLPSHRR